MSELCKSPQTFGNNVVLALDEDELLVIVVIGRAVLDAFPEEICGEVGVDDAVENVVRPCEAVAGSAVRVP